MGQCRPHLDPHRPKLGRIPAPHGPMTVKVAQIVRFRPVSAGARPSSTWIPQKLGDFDRRCPGLGKQRPAFRECPLPKFRNCLCLQQSNKATSNTIPRESDTTHARSKKARPAEPCGARLVAWQSAEFKRGENNTRHDDPSPTAGCTESPPGLGENDHERADLENFGQQARKRIQKQRAQNTHLSTMSKHKRL